tara:strand:+ start:108 stop:479 length:372 start_codon:yes stop_codon:yes gene_type:complete
MEKRLRINGWKSRGLIGDYEKIHTEWTNATNCYKCSKILIKKNMEHSHKTGEFRGIVCSSCNNSMFDKKIRADNTTKIKNVGFYNNRWFYKKIVNGITYQLWRKNKNQVLWYKFVCDILLKKK